MSEGESIGSKLRRLWKRSGLSLQAIADEMGMKKATVQRYFKDDWRENGTIDVELAMKLAKALEGRGNPPISKGEVLDLTGLPQVAAVTGTDYSPLSYEVTVPMAEVAARIALRGKEPPSDVVEAIARILTSLSALYESDPSARRDPAQTRGALAVLYRQFAPPAP